MKQSGFVCSFATVYCPWKYNCIQIFFLNPAPIQIGKCNKCKLVSFFPLVWFFTKCVAPDCISIWIHEDGYCLRKNLRGFQHHILTAISGTICFMLADITRLWTDLILKCYNVLYILILFRCGKRETHRTQPKKINCAFQVDVLMKKK